MSDRLLESRALRVFTKENGRIVSTGSHEILKIHRWFHFPRVFVQAVPHVSYAIGFAFALIVIFRRIVGDVVQLDARRQRCVDDQFPVVDRERAAEFVDIDQHFIARTGLAIGYNRPHIQTVNRFRLAVTAQATRQEQRLLSRPRRKNRGHF